MISNGVLRFATFTIDGIAMNLFEKINKILFLVILEKVMLKFDDDSKVTIFLKRGIDYKAFERQGDT